MKIPATPPQLSALFARVAEHPEFLISAVKHRATDGRYLHWETLRRRTPPEGLSHEDWWAIIKFTRVALLSPFPLRDTRGRSFMLSVPPAAAAMLHRVDRGLGGVMSATVDPVVTSATTRDAYLVRSLFEEAITSSQLEGASTTRKVAVEMLRTGRPPRDRSERMISNNFAAISMIRERTKEPLTPELVIELQQLLTEGTLDDESAAGRLRRADETVRVYDDEDQILHDPPPASELPGRMEAMCAFANGKDTAGEFTHPVVRAIMLHFWLAYDHPFVDGNGRTARALFYWSMLAQGYWLTELVSISEVLKGAPARYNRAFLYTETDGNDATYFVLFHLEVLCHAIEELHRTIARKSEEVAAMERRLHKHDDLNHRQIALLVHALKHADASFEIEGHATSHRVAYATARADLLGLTERGYLKKRKRGRTFIFGVAPDLARRLDR